jgi:hypothetical protein
VNFRVSRFSAFGQYQVTTGPRQQSASQTATSGETLIESGSLLTGATHTFSAGLRFNLGSAREKASTGGY